MRTSAIVSLAGLVGVGLAGWAQADDGNDGDAKPSLWAYPENLQKADGSRIRSGCLPGIMDLAKQMANEAPPKLAWIGKLLIATRFLDHPSYKYGVAYGDYQTYQFNFTKSCNLQDAGYEAQFYATINGKRVASPLVFDQVLNEYVDFGGMSRDDVDAHFLKDMQQECAAQLQEGLRTQQMDARGAQDALGYCQGHGAGIRSWPSWGAQSLYDITQKYGDAFYHQ